MLILIELCIINTSLLVLFLDLEKEEHSFQVISWHSSGDLENEVVRKTSGFVCDRSFGNNR